MNTPKTPKSPLMKAFSFGVEELSANKQGKLTARQQKILTQNIKVSRFSSGLAMIAILVSVGIMFGVLIFSSQGSVIKQAAPYLAETALVVIVITGIFTLKGLRRLRTLQKQEVSILEGRAHLTAKSLDYGRLKAYYALIGRTRFQLTSQQQFKVLVDGNKYRLYYILYPPTHIILSVEETV